MRRARPFSVIVSALGILFGFPTANAQTGAPQYQTVAFDQDTGLVSNTTDQTQTVISFPVIVSGATWLRLYFDTIELGDAVLRVTSYKDGDVQDLRARHCVEWQNSTCYFNGNAVQVEVEAPPHSGPYRLALGRADAGEIYLAAETQCGPTDDRVLSNDPRIARLMPVGCTGWLIEDCSRCLLTAGHCIGVSMSVAQFNVPNSDPAGNPVMPKASDQYSVDTVSVQGANSGVGNDWSYFGVFANSNTNLSAGYAQGWSFVLSPPPTGIGYTVQVAGHGVDTTPQSFNQVQQTHTGALVSNAGSTLGHQVDSEGGNSGSPIVDVSSGKAIGIHTNGGCVMTTPVGNNSGTASTHAALQLALKNPLGVCAANKLLASDGAAFDQFGKSLAVSGDTALVGALGDDDSGAGSGSSYVFVRRDNGWTQQAKLKASDGAMLDAFGSSVAMSGDTALIGSPFDDDSAQDSGSAYVFQRIGTSWAQQAKLLAGDGAVADWFGWSVALAPNVAAVGAYRDQDHGADSGSAYVFTRSGISWSGPVKLTPADGAAGDRFSYALAISLDTLAAGAPLDDDSGTDSGSVYVYVRSGASWNLQQKLIPGANSVGDRFGWTVALSGDTLAVGANLDDDAAQDAGSVSVFVRSSGSWSLQAKRTASDATAFDLFGCSVALHGETLVSGAFRDDDSGADAGAAYVFARTGSTWVQRMKLVPPASSANAFYGFNVALHGSAALVGAYQADDLGTDAGTAWACATPTGLGTIYCTAEVNSQGCLPAIRFSGVPSLSAASPFKLIASSVINKRTGQFFYGKSGRASTPFYGGVLCVAPPHKRGFLQDSGGTASGTDCTGSFSFDMNDWLRSGLDASVVAGTTIDGQYWYRDPQDTTGGRGSTNAVEFVCLP